MTNGRPTGSMLERFSRRVSPEPNTGCWLWSGGTNVWGYGIMSVGRKAEGHISAHRAAYHLHKGDPGNLYVLHRCDNRLCVNPDHLFLGTQKDNAQDKVAKGRQQDQSGARGPSAKLTAADVADIKSRRLRNVEFARLYGVSQSAVCDIINERTWRSTAT